jgi:orotate phosphoribosyltransferase
MPGAASFADRSLVAEMTAKMLLEIEAVLFRANEPFIFTSGWASPVYIDCRKLISFPRVRRTLVDFACSTLLRDVGFESIDTVVGGETAGIPFAAWIAEEMMLPMQYVRKKPKGFGRNAQIEGHLAEGARALLVEDLTTDGRSKINFCEALRGAGARVDHVFVIFYYAIFPESEKILSDLGVKHHSLATWWDVLAAAKKYRYFDTKTLSEVERFLHQPTDWSAEHGGTRVAGA